MRSVRPRRRDNEASRRKLTREDWIRAALAAMREGGVGAVAVEPLASGLGATKGSFYWHFRDRDELITASIGWWQADTATALAHVEELPAPADRLAGLVSTCFAPDSRRVLLAMMRSAEHPVVAPLLQQVLDERIAFAARVFAAGQAPDDRHLLRAARCWTRWLGALVLHAAAPTTVSAVTLPTPQEAREYVERLAAADARA